MKKILLLMLCTILLVGTISAFEFDNTKNYDSITKTITIENSFGLPFIGDKIAEVKLITPQVNKVFYGKDRKVMIFEVNNLREEYLNALDKMDFINLNKQNRTDNWKNYHYEYAIYEDVKITEYKDVCEFDSEFSLNVCHKEVVGSYIENKITRWEDLNGKNVPIGKLTIALVTDVERGDYYDGIPTFFGVKIPELASWQDSYSNGLVAYYKLDELSGRFTEDSVEGIYNGSLEGGSTFANGKINKGAYLDYNSTYKYVNVSSNLNVTSSFTWNAWIYRNGSGYYGNGYMGIVSKWKSGNAGVSFGLYTAGELAVYFQGGGWQTLSGAVIPIGSWHMVTLVGSNAGTSSIYLDGVLNGTVSGSWSDDTGRFLIGFNDNDAPFNGTIDEVGVWNRSLNSTEVLALYNGGNGLQFEQTTNVVVTITLTIPLNNTSTINSSLTFDSKATSTNSNLTNATLKVWYSNSSIFKTNFTSSITGLSNSTNLSISEIPPSSGYLWNVEWCSIDGGGVYNCSYASSNWTFDIISLQVEDETWNNVTTEGSTERFELNITLKDGLQLSSATLVYNNTNYAGIATNPSTNFYSITRSISIPSVNSNLNNTFYWSILTNDGTRTNTTSHNQSVLNVEFGNCSAYSTVIYNFTLYDEETQAKLNNGTIEVFLNLSDTSNTIQILNISQKFSNVNEASICTNNSLLTTINYSANVIVKYTANETGGTTYSIEYYHILNKKIGNYTVPQNIKLYPLDSTDLTEFQLTFRDSNLVLSPNILVQVWRQYVSDGDFKIVEIPLTDSNGQTILHLVRNDIIYNLVMLDSTNKIIATFNKIIAFCQDYTIGQCTIELNAPTSEQRIYNYTSDLQISYTKPIYSNVTNLVTMTFASLNLSSVSVEMKVLKNGGFGNRSVCTYSLTSATGTLSCDVSSITTTDRYLFVELYVNGELEAINTIDLESDSSGFGVSNGAFFAFLFFIMLITLFMEDKKMLVFSLAIGWAFIISFSLIKGALFGTFSGGIWLIVSIVIILWKLNKEDNQ